MTVGNPAAVNGGTKPSTASLAPAQLRELSTRADMPGIVRIASHLGAIAIVGAAIWHVAAHAGTSDALSLWLLLPLWLLQGYLIAFLFMAVHETAHKTAFRARWLNLVFGHASAATIVLPYEYYCLFHWDHHRYTQDPEKDPELVTGPVPESGTRLAIAFTGIVQLCKRMRLLLRHAIGGKVTAPWVPKDKRKLVVAEARAYLAAYALLLAGSVALGSTLLLWAWIVPLFIGQLILRPYLYTEHSGCGQGKSAYENTRTTYTNALVRWFAWNMPYHVEHHAYPAVPFHALPRLHTVIAGRIIYQEHSYRRSVRQAWHALRGAAQAGVQVGGQR